MLRRRLPVIAGAAATVVALAAVAGSAVARAGSAPELAGWGAAVTTVPLPPGGTHPPPPPAPTETVAVSPSDPVSVVLGDSVTFVATASTSSTWPSTFPAGLSAVLPGNQYVTTPASNSAFELVSAVPSAGTCQGGLSCDFGAVGPGAKPYVTFTLRATAVGSYSLIVKPSVSVSPTGVTVPVTVVPRRADLQVRGPSSPLAVKVGRTATAHFVVTNEGPNTADGGVVTVGQPRPLVLVAAVAGGSCTTVPIKCTLPELPSGASVVVTVSTKALRAAKSRIPVGVSISSAVDADGANNAAWLAVTATAPSQKRR